MKFPQYQRGVTLIEMLVVLALVGIIGGFALFTSLDTYRGTSFRSDRDLVVALLERSRSQAMNNLCSGGCTNGKPHGVAIRPSNHLTSYVAFQGQTYATRDVAVDDIFNSNPVVGISGFSEAVFAQLAATSTVVGGTNLTISDLAGHSSVITVSPNGQITWTN